MTLDEAIKHCEEVVEEQEKKSCDLYENQDYEKSKDCIWCAKEHRQLAEWLRELKRLREEQKDVYTNGYDEGYDYGYNEGYEDAKELYS